VRQRARPVVEAQRVHDVVPAEVTRLHERLSCRVATDADQLGAHEHPHRPLGGGQEFVRSERRPHPFTGGLTIQDVGTPDEVRDLGTEGLSVQHLRTVHLEHAPLMEDGHAIGDG
jgi:hypothetical protein